MTTQERELFERKLLANVLRRQCQEMRSAMSRPTASRVVDVVKTQISTAESAARKAQVLPLSTLAFMAQVNRELQQTWLAGKLLPTASTVRRSQPEQRTVEYHTQMAPPTRPDFGDLTISPIARRW